MTLLVPRHGKFKKIYMAWLGLRTNALWRYKDYTGFLIKQRRENWICFILNGRLFRLLRVIISVRTI